jgi:molybdopterin synthase sulfur carrier subunit
MAEIRYFGGAAEATATDAETVTGSTLGAVKSELSRRYGSEFERVLGRCSILVNGQRATDDATPLAPTDALDVLPPFAGG